MWCSVALFCGVPWAQLNALSPVVSVLWSWSRVQIWICPILYYFFSIQIFSVVMIIVWNITNEKFEKRCGHFWMRENRKKSKICLITDLFFLFNSIVSGFYFSHMSCSFFVKCSYLTTQFNFSILKWPGLYYVGQKKYEERKEEKTKWRWAF